MSTLTPVRSLLALSGSAALLVLAIAVPAGPFQAPKPSAGETIFKKQCASCHGAKGQGGPAYDKPLVGNRSVAELAKFLHQSMPPGPVKVSTKDAQTVAAYVHEAFYSPIAQERNRPARVSLSRLTVRQFRNAVTDLVSGFQPVAPAEPPTGLRGQYFKGRDLSDKGRMIDRVDPRISFDFGTGGPIPDKFDPHNFSITWEGSILAPDTGEYEFIVQSDHAVRMWINGERQPFIDGWVRALSDKEFRGTATLLGGRSYPVRLEFSKASQGVNDDDKKKGKPSPPASVSLLWRRPKQAAEEIPTHFLFPQGSPTRFVVTSPFPADDRSIGYERGNTVSKEWDEATTAAALEAAGYVATNLSNVSGVPDDAPDRRERLIGFCRHFVERAFRHPLSKESEQVYVTRQFTNTGSLDGSVKRVVVLALKSPRFLYREIGNDPKDPYTVASHLSFGLWDTLPDSALLQAAARGELATPEGVARQAERMANDPRAWTKLRDFLLLWLKVDEVPDIVKSDKRFPGFDGTAAADLRTSLELFLEKNAWSKESDFRQLLLDRSLYLNGRLGKLYGAKLPPNAPFQPVELDSEQRAGILTHPYLLSRFAYVETSSPIHRGVLVARSLLGRTLRPPPQAFTPLAPSLHPSLTTRQRVALQTKPDACNSCHSMINPLGFTLERFDAIGRLRADENGKPIDATGSYKTRSGDLVKFAGAIDLAKYLANSDESHAAFVEKLFHHLVKQPALAYGPRTVSDLQVSFEKDRYSIRSLMVKIMMATAQQEGHK